LIFAAMELKLSREGGFKLRGVVKPLVFFFSMSHLFNNGITHSVNFCMAPMRL
jgi:hypothetical protein